ncbi:hypothetical protein EDD21DRAFT_419495 [Dissophora ornata]|nr:hypothetical protein EDD21DRAFT_419495 [Dissophora ornata]
MELLLKEILPTETLPWVQISHAIKFSIVFVDATKKSLVVKAPFTLGHILNVRDLPSSTWVFDVDGQNSTAGVPLPGYGADMGQSTLLDSNTRPRGGGRSGETDGMELPPTYVSDGVVPPLAEK